MRGSNDVYQKYAITLLLGTLCLSYTVLTDCLFGFPWYNFMINWQFTLFSIVEADGYGLCCSFLIVTEHSK